MWCAFLNYQYIAAAGFIIGVVLLNYAVSGIPSFQLEYPTSYVAMYAAALVGIAFTCGSMARRQEWLTFASLTIVLAGGVVFVIVWLCMLW